MAPHPPKHILPLIVLSQFCCTSLWFASNGIMDPLIAYFDLPRTALGHLTASVQVGFIVGTLVFALLGLADRFKPSRLFMGCAILGALLNLGIIFPGNSPLSLSVLRFGTGFFLAGIYPVGMKIAADHFGKELSKALGYLVGALVIGTAFPHLLREMALGFPWQWVVVLTSALALLGGVAMLLGVPEGPYRKAGTQIALKNAFRVFKQQDFRAAALGYFGHMWELYAFWAFVPVLLTAYSQQHQTSLPIPLWSFLIIAIGGVGCVLGGYLSKDMGIQKTARTALLISGICCFLSPWALGWNNPQIFVGFLLLWGLAVVTDSPLFSTLVANNTLAETKGTALTIVNCIGYTISVVSIQVLQLLLAQWDSQWAYLILGMGPVLGLMAMRKPIAKYRV